MAQMNVFFDQLENSAEQQLLHELVNEAIEMYGRGMYYIPRRRNNPDKLYGADDVSSFDTAYMVPIYVSSFEGFQGDQTFMSKMGLEIRDRLILIIARKAFEEEILANEDARPVPEAGDLIYYPDNKKCFEIKYTDYLPTFYPLGTLPSYRLVCELFEYSNEHFSTGIPEIDVVETRLSTDALTYALRDADGTVLADADGLPLIAPFTLASVDPLSDNENLDTTGKGLIDWSEKNPFNDEQSY